MPIIKIVIPPKIPVLILIFSLIIPIPIEIPNKPIPALKYKTQSGIITKNKMFE